MPEQEVPMPRRKQAAAAAELTPESVIPPQAPESAPPAPPESPKLVSEPSRPDQAPRPLLADPFPFKTVNVGSGKLHLQHSRQAGEMQIRFGGGSRQEMPSDATREFIKSHKIKVETKDGEKEVQVFHWNDHDRAWGMRLDRENPETSKQTARKIFDEVVKFVAAERGAEPEQGR
jgi:hypothetical protein